jgi:hypothetical protein
MSQALHHHYPTQHLSNTFADVFADSGSGHHKVEKPSVIESFSSRHARIISPLRPRCASTQK